MLNTCIPRLEEPLMYKSQFCCRKKKLIIEKKKKHKWEHCNTNLDWVGYLIEKEVWMLITRLTVWPHCIPADHVVSIWVIGQKLQSWIAVLRNSSCGTQGRKHMANYLGKCLKIMNYCNLHANMWTRNYTYLIIDVIVMTGGLFMYWVSERVPPSIYVINVQLLAPSTLEAQHSHFPCVIFRRTTIPSNWYPADS